jgi:FkbH-like protein
MTESAGLGDMPAVTDAEQEWLDLVDAWMATDDYATLVRVGRRLEKLATAGPHAERLVPVRLAVLSDATTDLLIPVLKAAFLAAGLKPDLYRAPYGQVAVSLLDPAGPLAAFRPQLVVVLNTTWHLPAVLSPQQSKAEVEEVIDAVCQRLLGPCERFHEHSGADVILNTFHAPLDRPLGHLGAKLPGDLTNFVRRLNVALGDRAPRFVHLADVAFLAERLGLSRWFDERCWYEAKQPIALDAIGEYARSVAAIGGAILGRSRKCLIVDLDNTLWGGVIGDDGVGGILIGPGSATGEAHAAFQHYLKRLKERGVLLAVCSKNEDAVARTAFSHPDMVLAETDFVAFTANWSPKSDNIRALSRDLDLPLESFVFVDDNPAERAEVARALPGVAVVPVPDDPSGFIAAIERARLFEAVSVSGEDLARTASYQARRVAIEARADSTDLDGYLRSLDMHADIGPFDEVALERVTQLVNKTNQFNLTTPRVVLADMRRLIHDPDAVTCTVRLRDRYADHGLISVAFGHIDGDRLSVDAWLMSCRVLGRGVERVVFNYLLDQARTRGAVEIVGAYRRTGRNGLVKDLYRDLGFERIAATEQEETWRLTTLEAEAVDVFIEVHRT